MTQGYWEQQFNERLEALKAQGLVDMKFTTNQVAAGLMTREEFFKEACHMIDVVEKGEGRDVDVDARIACVEGGACKQSFDLQRMREVARKQAERLAPVFEAAVDRADLRGIRDILEQADQQGNWKGATMTDVTTKTAPERIWCDMSVGGVKVEYVRADIAQEHLADTRRAIIEAAEKRGYERAIAEMEQKP